MKSRELLRIGITGSILAGFCCFSPILVIIFSMFGVLTWLKWTDFVLFPMLGSFLILTIYAIERIRRDQAEPESQSQSQNPTKI